MGGMNAFGGATEQQGNGTPYLHAEGRIVCGYECDTMLPVQLSGHPQRLRNTPKA